MGVQTGTSRGRLRAALALGLGLALAASAVLVVPSVASADVPAAKAPLLERTDDVISSDPLPTVQIDSGYVWAQATVGNIVYAGGSFTNARAALAAPGTSLTPRSNILAYDITTGELQGFAPTVNGVIKAVAASPDGSRIYIGGSFTQVNGTSRHNFAALDAQTGQLVPGFAPSVGGAGVYGIAVSGDSVYVGGNFTQANSVARKNLAAFASTNGALRDWAPTTDQQVDALVMEPGAQHVIAGGRFYRVNDVVQRGLVALDPTTGGIDTGWAAPNTVKNGGALGTSAAGKTGIFGLSTDGTGVYGTGWVYTAHTAGNLEGAFAAEAGTGAIRWVADCHGDSYGVYSTGKVIYTTSHVHACETANLFPEQSTRTWRYMQAFTATAEGTLTRSASLGSTYADWNGTPSPSAYAVTPDFTVGTATGLGQAGLTITGAGDYVAMAGEFTSVNNKMFQGIVRFSTKPAGGAKQGPRLSGTDWATPTAASTQSGRVRVSTTTNWDRDNRDLTYQLLRSDSATPVDQVTTQSVWWQVGAVVLNDTTASPGTNYTYTVKAVDADGNSATSPAVSVTAAGGTSSDYANMVLDDRAELYYPLGNVSGDWAGGSNPVRGSGVSNTAPGAVNGTTGASASAFSGSTSGRVSSTTAARGDDNYAAEAWFKTTTTRGGKIFGYGNSQTGSSGSNDRNVYMLNNGRLTYGVNPVTMKTITTPTSFNDGRWHHVVSTLSPEGMILYVDGKVVAQDDSVVAARNNYNGYWRVGYDSLSGWPSAPTSAAFAGSIDEFAVYPDSLTPAQVAQHYATGMGFAAPVTSFMATATDLSVAFTGTATADTGETITGYSWDFGDGATATGATPTHEYEASGTYTVTLTATDSRGIIGVSTQQVTALAPNVLPTADFTPTVTGLTAVVDGATSTDPDGTISGYSWNWGDGTPAGAGVSATHAYATAGTYTVTLTVTDDRGGEASKTADVVVSHADPVASFEASSNVLDVNVDASASTASDAATLTYSWNWGDGSPAGTGVTASHRYAAAGSYTITLTVLDSLGATATTTHTATVADKPFAIRDDFERTTASGWGSADAGGSYTVMNGAASAASVGDGQGLLTLAAGQTRNVALQGTSLADTLTSLTYSLDQAPSTGVSYVGVSARKSATNEYLARVWMRADGKLWLTVRNGSTVIATQALTTTWDAGDEFRLAVNVSGASPTTIQVKTWKDGAIEPADWQLTVTDSTAGLQDTGWTSVHASRGSTATSTAVFSFDSLRVTDLKAPLPNVAPTAAFTSTVTDLGVAVDGSTSADSDGTVAGYSWNWGDGTAAGTGATATHTYAAAGTYDVTLTVTDDDGATGTVTHQVVATDPPVVDPAIARDAFARTATSGWGASDVGGTWTLTGGAASAASVADGAGKLTLAAGGTRNMLMNAVSAKNVTMSADFSADAAPSTGSAYVGLIARSSATDNYLVRAWLNANGTVSIVIQQGSAVLSSYVVPGITRGAGDAFTLKVDVAGGASTTISAKLWRQGATEPANWQTSFVDTTGIDASGAVGVHGSRVSSATAPTVISIDNFRVLDNG